MRCARIRSIREFDDAYTAPFHGFQDAADYYHRASAMRVIDKISVPTLIITAADDPFVPPGPFREPAVTAQPQHHAEAHAARRPLRLRRGSRGTGTTATGRSGKSCDFLEQALSVS